MTFSSNKRILILGNGPSLIDTNLKSIRGVATLGMNAAYRHWEKINWYPEIYANLDDQVVVSHQDAIVKIQREERCKVFLLHPNILHRYPELSTAPNVFFISSFLRGPVHDRVRSDFGLPKYGTEYFKSKQPGAITTGSFSVRFAAYLGFTEFLLLGIDCRYVEILPEARAVGGIALEIAETPLANPNYFFSDYQRKGDRYNIPNPATGDPQLHLNAFKALAEDNRERGFNLDIHVGTQRSALFDQQVFPYMHLTAFTHRELSAVFIPLSSGETQRAADVIKSWSSFAQLPSANSERSVSLCLAFNKLPGAKELELLKTAFENLNSRIRHFSELRIYSSFLEGLDDLYIREQKIVPGPEGYSAGPNNQHFDIIFRFSRGYSHIFVMELDCVPIRPFWLDRIAKFVETSDEFWIAGASYDGKGVPKAFYQINGNAIYNVGSDQFLTFYQEHLLSHFYKRAEAHRYLSYDVVAYDLLSPLFNGSGEAKLYRLWQVLNGKMVVADFIVNVSMVVDQEFLVSASLPDLRRAFPESSFVHGLKRHSVDNDVP